jgi:hypothetical protein
MRHRGPFRTQRVTLADLENGQIRVPSTSTASTKELFPGGNAAIVFILRGRSIRGEWDPGMDPDRQRSGVLRVLGAELRELVCEDEVLRVSVQEDGGHPSRLTSSRRVVSFAASLCLTSICFSAAQHSAWTRSHATPLSVVLIIIWRRSRCRSFGRTARDRAIEE